jgi:hypothetical protein
MYLTPSRLNKQIDKTDKLMRVLWRLYSPYRSHRKIIVKASYKIIEVLELLETLQEEIKKEYKAEKEHPLEKRSIPPGYQDSYKEIK